MISIKEIIFKIRLNDLTEKAKQEIKEVTERNGYRTQKTKKYIGEISIITIKER